MTNLKNWKCTNRKLTKLENWNPETPESKKSINRERSLDPGSTPDWPWLDPRSYQYGYEHIIIWSYDDNMITWPYDAMITCMSSYDHMIPRWDNHMVMCSYGRVVMWSYHRMIIWWHDHMIIWSYDDTIVWSYEHVVIRSYDRMTIWWHGHMIIWSHDHMIIWSCDHMITRSHDHIILSTRFFC